MVNISRKGVNAMSGSYTESDYENSIIELFQNMGYRYVYGPDIDRDYGSPLY